MGCRICRCSAGPWNKRVESVDKSAQSKGFCATVPSDTGNNSWQDQSTQTYDPEVADIFDSVELISSPLPQKICVVNQCTQTDDIEMTTPSPVSRYSQASEGSLADEKRGSLHGPDAEWPGSPRGDSLQETTTSYDFEVAARFAAIEKRFKKNSLNIPSIRPPASPKHHAPSPPLAEAKRMSLDSDAKVYSLLRKSIGADGNDSSDDEILMQPPRIQRGRGAAVSAEVYGHHNPRRVYMPAKVWKSEEHTAMLAGALMNCPLTSHMAGNELERLVEEMSIVRIPPRTTFLHAHELGDALFVVLEGCVDCCRSSTLSDYKTRVKQLFLGDVFGELSILWSAPISLSYISSDLPCTFGRLSRDAYQGLVVRTAIRNGEERRTMLRQTSLFEVMGDEDLAKLEESMEKKSFSDKETIIRQSDVDQELYLMLSGEAAVSIATQNDSDGTKRSEFEVKRYFPGAVFGERALITGEPRAATVKAIGSVEVLCITLSKFERMFGSMRDWQGMQYINDPRTCIAKFYGNLSETHHRGTDWFAVYRPTSCDAISKMLTSVAVGKGLNVKGKSAKKGVLSGFVPFLQIHENSHKSSIETSPPDSRISIFYKTSGAREEASVFLQGLMIELDGALSIEHQIIFNIDTHIPGAYGLDVPEDLVMHAYIRQQDISPIMGWETGRVSEPSFMDMNLRAIRGFSDPQITLIQWDENSAMNPHGLLLGYIEESVKPVVSDFDTFTVGSLGATYEPISESQTEIARWALERLRDILEQPSNSSWTSRWLQVLKHSVEEGFHPDMPKYGFGDPVSYGLISDVIEATGSTGAVRHGAECFNFYFPQELDDEYLVVWSGFVGRDWEYRSEPKLREFLLERAREGYSFPINPVWPVRDPGWYEIFQALELSSESKWSLSSWFQTATDVINRMHQLHREHPTGFGRFDCGAGEIGEIAGDEDCDTRERADLLLETVTRRQKWARARARVSTMVKLGGLRRSTIEDSTDIKKFRMCPAGRASVDAVAPSHHTPSGKYLGIPKEPH